MASTCICGGLLGAANQHGIRLCARCCGTTDADGLYLADPRANRDVYHPAMRPIHRDEGLGRDVETLDIGPLVRAYLAAADRQMRLLLPPEEWTAIPQYDQLLPHQRNYVVAVMAEAIEVWLGLDGGHA
jgi:hypothetical protein